MPALADLLPKQSQTVGAIYAHHKHIGNIEPPRQYLGMSEIGGPCKRALWYKFRHCCKPDFTGRFFRLFETGDLAEIRFTKELRAIGCEVHDVNENGEQFAFNELGGHFSGHMDGCAIGIPEAPETWHVLEFKTHNAKSFTELTKEGVEKSKPQHYAQMQCYMHSSGMTRALYLAVNKDTDELYSERIRYDKEAAKRLIERAEQIITNITPPERISDRPDFYQCKWCDARAICWGIQEEGKCQALPVPAISCRQCCHATPAMDGNARWVCEKHKRSLSEADQAKACDDHLCLPGLFAFAEPEEYGKYTGSKSEYIDFKNEDGKIWQHGCGEGGFTTKELMQLSQQQLSVGMIDVAKNLYQAEVTGVCHDDILLRYPAEDSEVVWKGRAGQLEQAWKDAFRESMNPVNVIKKSDNFECQAAEFTGGRVAIIWPATKEAEIRRGKE